MVMPTGASGGEMKSDINVTPLVDVMLVLLIIFMITAPMLTTGIELDLPEGTITEAEEDDPDQLVLSIDADRHIYLGETRVAWDDLHTLLETNERVQTERTLYVEADTSLPYGVVVAAMDTAQAAGVRHLMMRTDPVDDAARQEMLGELGADGGSAGANGSEQGGDDGG